MTMKPCVGDCIMLQVKFVLGKIFHYPNCPAFIQPAKRKRVSSKKMTKLCIIGWVPNHQSLE